MILSALHPDAKLRPSDAAQFGSELARALRLPPSAAERVTRRKWLALAPLAAAGAGAGAWRIYMTRALSRGERVIEYQGGKDPEEAGFTRSHSIQGTVVQNETRTGWGAWRMISADQGFYFRGLSGRQAAHALRLGWRLRAELKAEAGWAYAGLISEAFPKRYDVCTASQPERSDGGAGFQTQRIH